MARTRYVSYLSVLLALLLYCCQKPYNPKATTAPANYLVVEGVINTGNDSTIFTLSKTVSVNAKPPTNPVTDAVVLVENDAGGVWFLVPNGAGQYASGPLYLPASQNYRIRITTSDE